MEGRTECFETRGQEVVTRSYASRLRSLELAVLWPRSLEGQSHGGGPRPHEKVTATSLLPPQTSVLHMCSLFHAFIFAQLWTVYCEQSAVATNIQNQNEFSFTAILTALEFWSRVTPSILQLMAHNKVVSAQSAFPPGRNLEMGRPLPVLTLPDLSGNITETDG